MPKNDGKNLKRELNRLYKKEYELNKQKLLLVERDNYGHVFAIKTQDGWCKVLSHSALLLIYYAKPVAEAKIDRKISLPTLKADLDFRYTSPIGVVNFPKKENLEAILIASGAEKAELPEGLDKQWILCYKLDHEMLEKEFWKLKEEEDALWDKTNTVIVPKAIFPNLGVDLREMSKLLYDVARKLDRSARELVGGSIIDLIRRVSSGLIMAEKGVISWKSFFDFAPKLLCEIDANITVLTTVRAIDKNVLIRMAESVARVEDDVKTARKKYEAR